DQIPCCRTLRQIPCPWCPAFELPARPRARQDHPQEARMKAGQVMTFGAATIQPQASIREAARMMLDYRISGLPVVDGEGNLVGIVTEGDLIGGITGDHKRRSWLEFILDNGNANGLLEQPQAQTVDEIMTREVITAS